MMDSQRIKPEYDDKPKTAEEVLAGAQRDYDTLPDRNEAERAADLADSILAKWLKRPDLKIKRRAEG